MNSTKPRVIKDFEKLEPHIQEQIKLVYPEGFSENLITFYNKEGKKVSALPFETDEKYYMVRMTVMEAEQIIEDDDDYIDGSLRDSVKTDFEDKYGDIDYIADNVSEDSEDEQEEDD